MLGPKINQPHVLASSYRVLYSRLAWLGAFVENDVLDRQEAKIARELDVEMEETA
jgi:hypothetical protein